MLRLYSKVPQSIWRVGFFLCLACVLYLALSPAPPHVLTTGWDKTNHALAFIGLTFLLLKAFRLPLQIQALLLLALGILIELLQGLVPNRLAEWADLLADAVGVLIGYGTYWLIEYVSRADRNALQNIQRPTR